jgi:hypothetical protein
MSRVLTVLAVAWIAGFAWYGLTSVPQLPLDVSAADPATIDALNAARLKHGLTFAALALVPAAMLLWLGRRLGR